MHEPGQKDPGHREAPNSNEVSVLVIVPAFNERATIQGAVTGLRKERKRLASRGIRLSIFVVDDGSTDGTGQLAAEAGADRVLRHRVNQGLGAAVRTGMRAGKEEGYDVVVKFDADLQHDPSDIPPLIQPVLDDSADIVYGNRFADLRYRMPLLRRAGNLAFSRLMAWLTGWPLKDSQPGILAVNRRYLEAFSIPGDYNYTQQVLLEAYHRHLRFAHVPVTFRQRPAGESFVSLAYPFRVIPQILLVIASIRPMRIFLPIGLGFLLLAGLVFTYQLVNWLLGHSTRPVENVNLVLGSALFGLQTVFFGILAQMIAQLRQG